MNSLIQQLFMNNYFCRGVLELRLSSDNKLLEQLQVLLRV